ncbi:hypothetical protein GOSPT_054_00260 [Gordonia sputi NBRC 100414]|uniref:Uncharacterized protein n=1 Tax=Gordonia sputi NBRC 100414 TaxID=1089453 RepID=H5TZT5_9ACTN|nr:hypothetical protein A5766_03900 [Gordonia sp. 852002-51296_SCH5728562-b]GAB38993.1 hypothetical protein GOSPT_054_00260 [Gordonia sputi NBRC 100414]
MPTETCEALDVGWEIAESLGGWEVAGTLNAVDRRGITDCYTDSLFGWQTRRSFDSVRIVITGG